MIKIDEKFSIKKYAHGWELHYTTKSDHDKSTTGFVTNVTYYPNLTFIAKAIVDLSCGECTTANEILSTIVFSTNHLVEKLSNLE